MLKRDSCYVVLSKKALLNASKVEERSVTVPQLICGGYNG